MNVMDSQSAQSTYFMTAAIVVVAVSLAVWWYTATSAPAIPNTGVATSTLEYTPTDER